MTWSGWWEADGCVLCLTGCYGNLGGGLLDVNDNDDDEWVTSSGK